MESEVEQVDEEEFFREAGKVGVSRIAREAISRSLEELVPAQDISPGKIRKIRKVIYEAVLSAACDYGGRYDSVPNMWSAGEIRRVAINNEVLSYGVKQEILHIADVVESVRRN